MILSANTTNSSFEKAPKGMGRAVIVDITPPEEVISNFNGKETKRKVFSIVFELDPEAFGTRTNGEPYNTWSRKFTLTLDERSNTRQFLRSVLGRDLTAQELQAFDAETLIGFPVEIMIAHTPSKDGSTTYATIASVAPWIPENNGGKPAYTPSGKFVRKQDRPPKDAPTGAKAAYRRADVPEDAGREDWQRCKIHVGNFKGSTLDSLDEEAIMNLYNRWLPTLSARQAAGERISADDNRLAGALEKAKAALDAAKTAEQSAEDVDTPY